MLVCKCEVEPVGEATNKEILERVPDGIAIMVIDKRGDLHPFKLSTARVAKHIKESDFPIATSAITRIESHSMVSFKGSSCHAWVSYGAGIRLC